MKGVTGATKTCKRLWEEVVQATSETTSQKMTYDYARKKVWLGESGKSSFSSLMTKARASYRQPTGE